MTELPPHIPDEELVRAEIADAALEEREISPTAARIIAGWWHNGQASAFYSFMSTGAIDRLAIENEYVQTYNQPDLSDFDKLALDYFGTYLLHAHGVDEAGNRGPVSDWHNQTQWGTDV